MERRVLLAVVLSIGLILLVNILFPPVPAPVERPPVDTVTVADSPDAASDSVREPTAPLGEDLDGGTDTGRADGQARQEVAPDTADAEAMARITGEEAPPEDTVRVRSALAEYEFSTRGAALIAARLLEFESYAEEDEEGDPVQLVPPGDRFFSYGIAVGSDTVGVSNLTFEPSATSLELSAESPRDSLVFVHQFRGSEARFVVTYHFRHDGYLVEVDGRVEGLQGRGYGLLADLGPGLRSNEKNFEEDHGQYAMVTNGEESGVESVQFNDIEEGEVRPATGGPFHWVGIKSKYFLVAVVAQEDGPMFGGATIRGLGPGPRELQQVGISTSLPVPAGTPGFRFGAYLGPQDYGRLDAIGRDLQDVSSYGYQWLQPVIRPLVAIVMPILVWMHTRFDLAYGWVLILFGVLMRVVLFPLYQKSMRAQIGQMRLQPVVKEIREKYKDDPQKMQQEMMRVYKEEGVNPLAGCLPMLVPMPVLFTLFFVFQGTIEFRGVPFLWLPDLSLKDPLYIIPLVMGASMFLLQWIGQRSMDSSNTQMKVMMYAMPVFFTFLFANFPSGLNLYYTTSNLASLPQQLYIAKERKAATAAQGSREKKAKGKAKDGGGGG